MVAVPVSSPMAEVVRAGVAVLDAPSELLDGAVARGLDRATVQTLLRDAPPMWSRWGDVDRRIDDLLLVARRLGTGELRVRVTAPVDASREWEISVVAEDRPGLLAITATVLAQNNISILSATIASWPMGQAIQTLRVRSDDTGSVEPPWPFIGQDLRHALLHGAANVGSTMFSSKWVVGRSVIDATRQIVSFDAPDDVGVLACIAGALAGAGVNIVAGEMMSTAGRARDTFVVEVGAEVGVEVGAGSVDRLDSVLGQPVASVD